MASLLDPSWTPQGDLTSERTWLIGSILMGVGYGFVVILSAICLSSLSRTISPSNRAQRTIMIVYVSLTFTLATLFMAGTAWMTQMSFVDYRLYPGGPAKFEVDLFSLPIDSMATLSAVLASWLADALLCWRCIVMYSSNSTFIWVTRGIPIFLYITEVAVGVMWIIQVSTPSASAWSMVHATNFTAPYFWLNFGFNVAATIAIVGRLLFFRQRISAALGPGYGAQYISVAAMMVESALLYSTVLLLFLIPFSIHHPLQNMFLQFFGEAQVIPSLLIVYRVASGKAWTNTTSTEMFSSVEGSWRADPSHDISMEVLSPSNHFKRPPSKHPITFQQDVDNLT